MNLPQQYSENMRALLGGEFEAFLASMEKPHCRALRENPMRPAGGAFAGKPVPWYEGAYYIEEESLAGSSIQHFAGAFYLQEPSAMTAAAVLNVQKNERVLDLCAAPGGKGMISSVVIQRLELRGLATVLGFMFFSFCLGKSLARIASALRSWTRIDFVYPARARKLR